MADSVDRRLVRASVGEDVAKQLGLTWLRLKGLVEKAKLKGEEKPQVALQLVEDMRAVANEFCDTLKERIERHESHISRGSLRISD